MGLSEDDIDDLLYFARIGDTVEFGAIKKELCQRENIDVVKLVESAKDEQSGNGVFHMAAANGHHGMLATHLPWDCILRVELVIWRGRQEEEGI